MKAVVLTAALLCASCAPRAIPLPGGAGTPATDAADVLASATRACRAVSTISAEIGVSGSAGGRRLRVRLLAGLGAPSNLRLEAVAPFGQPVFILVARDEDATLFLPRDGRVLEHGRPGEVIDALAGVPLDPASLRIALTGCTAQTSAGDATQFGDDWRRIPDGDGDVYFHRENRTAPWRVVAAVHRAAGGGTWRAEYRDFLRGASADGLPGTVRLSGGDGKGFDLRLSLSQIEINAPFGADVFTVKVPAGTRAITLDELRRSGPLAAGGDGS